MINNGINLNGNLIGIHITRKNGTVEHNWLREPVHNTVVYTGIKHLLKYNGTDNLIGVGYSGFAKYLNPFFVVGGTTTGGNTFYPHEGIFNYMGIGTGTSITDVNMTTLEQPVSGTWIKKALTGSLPYTGVCMRDKGLYTCRVTHTSNPVSSDVTISEFGLFGKAAGSYVMFSRVLIPASIRPVLNTGDSVSFTYEVELSIKDDGGGRIADIGLVDGVGNNLGYGALTSYVMCTSANCPNGSWMDNGGSYPREETGFFYNAQGGRLYTSEYGTLKYDMSFIAVPWTLYFEIAGLSLSSAAQATASCNQYIRAYVGGIRESSAALPTWGGNNAAFIQGTVTSGWVVTNGGNNPTSYSGSYNSMKNLQAHLEGTNYRDYNIRIANISNSTRNIYNFRHCGMEYRFFKVVDGVDTPTPIQLGVGKILEFRFRWSINAVNNGIK